jgi:phenylpropionate dioxygenase-like ring-hydroxylating dioxygenase large terminal subunit
MCAVGTDNDTGPDVRARINAGFTVPASYYADRTVLERERGAIFRRYWQYVGAAEKVAEPGSCFAAVLGDLPILLTRDLSGELHALVNVCRHRGMIVVDGERTGIRSMRCPYHAWTYALDGRLTRVNGPMSTHPDFDVAANGLHELRVEQWGPLLFASANPDVAPLATYLGALETDMNTAGLSLDSSRYYGNQSRVIEANWKIVIDNFLECYHCPTVHPSTFRDTADLSQNIVTAHEYVIHSSAPIAEDHGGWNPAGKPGKYVVALMWPNSKLTLFPGGTLAARSVLPVGHRATSMKFEFYFGPEASSKEADEFIDVFIRTAMEDVPICEGVQRGLEASGEWQAPLNPRMENGVQRFAQLYFEALNP